MPTIDRNVIVTILKSPDGNGINKTERSRSLRLEVNNEMINKKKKKGKKMEEEQEEEQMKEK